LPNRFKIPDAKMLHEFRDRLSVASLRQINGQLLRPLLDQLDPSRKTVAIMDSTDLAAAAFKKTKRVGRRAALPWGYELPSREPVAGLLATRSTL
jgi:hypothetical protein